MSNEAKAREMRERLGEDWEIQSGVGPDGGVVCASKYPLSITWRSDADIYAVTVESTKLASNMVVDEGIGVTIREAAEVLFIALAIKANQYGEARNMARQLIIDLSEEPEVEP